METERPKQTLKGGYCFRPHVATQREESKSYGGAHEARGWHLIASLDLRRPGPIAAITTQSVSTSYFVPVGMNVRSTSSDYHFPVPKFLEVLSGTILAIFLYY